MADETPRQEEVVRERIEHTRAHMGETIEEIADHLDPDHLKHEFKAGVREEVEQTKREVRDATIGKAERMMHDVERTASETGRTLMDTILNNPVPAAMTAIGLGWLISEARKTRTRRGRREYALGGIASTAPGYVGAGGYTAPPMSRAEQARAGAALAGGRVQHQAGEAADRVQHTASDVAEQVRGTAERARQGASRAMDEAQHSAERTWHEAEHQARRAQVQARQTARENPLAAGAALLALGFAAGMALPETQTEDRAMGPARDRLMDRAQAAVGQAGQMAMKAGTEVAKGAAQQATTAAKETVQQAKTAAKETVQQATQ